MPSANKTFDRALSLVPDSAGGIPSGDASREPVETPDWAPSAHLEDALAAFDPERAASAAQGDPVDIDVITRDIRSRMARHGAGAGDNTALAAVRNALRHNWKLLAVGVSALVAGGAGGLVAVANLIGGPDILPAVITPAEPGGASTYSRLVEYPGAALSADVERLDNRANTPQTSAAGSFALPAGDTPGIGAGAVPPRTAQGAEPSPSREIRTPTLPTVALPSGVMARAPVAPSVPPPGPQVVLVSEPLAVEADEVVYSTDDVDVLPPTVRVMDLPSPAVPGRPTLTNSLEVIVSSLGTVEHVRFLGAPRRMVDAMVLSQAKMWQFGPASKDDRPVRYRLVLQWQVNP